MSLQIITTDYKTYDIDNVYLDNIKIIEDINIIKWRK